MRLFFGSIDSKCRATCSMASRRSTRISVWRTFFALSDSNSSLPPHNITDTSDLDRRKCRFVTCWSKHTMQMFCVFNDNATVITIIMSKVLSQDAYREPRKYYPSRNKVTNKSNTSTGPYYKVIFQRQHWHKTLVKLRFRHNMSLRLSRITAEFSFSGKPMLSRCPNWFFFSTCY